MKKRLRFRCRDFCALASAVAAVGLSVNPALALNINQWTGNAGTSSWNTAGNWLDNNVPNSGDDAVIYNSPVDLTANSPTAGALLVAKVGSTATLDTNGNKLTVAGTISLDGGILYANTAPSGSVSVLANTINVTGGGYLDMFMSSSSVRVSNNSSGYPNGMLTADGTSTIITDGTLNTGFLTCNGVMEANGPSTINVGDLSSNGVFTLAGTASQAATLRASDTTMTINCAAFDFTNPYATVDLSSANSSLSLNGPTVTGSSNIGATFNIGDTSTLSVGVGNWTIGYFNGSTPHGVVNLNGGPTLARAAQIEGYVSFAGDVNVTGYANLPQVELHGGAVVNVSSGGYLYLTNPLIIETAGSSPITLGGTGQYEMNGGVQIGISGTSQPYTTAVVNAGTVFDWDGTSEAAGSCTITNGELDIYSSTIDVIHSFPAPYGYQGSINITGGAKLNVAGTAWNMYGTMNLSPGAIVAGQTLTLDGSYLSPGNYSLYPAFIGTTFPVIQAPLVINPNTYIYMQFNGGLHLDGATTWNGGGVLSAPFISGQSPYGILVQDGNATVSASTDIFCAVLDMDGTSNTATWTINPGVIFTQQAYSLDTAGSTTNPFHSTLTLQGGTIDMQTSSGVWTLAGGTINMNQSGFDYPNIVDSKLILGSGATVGTIAVGLASSAYINAPLQSAATSVAGGNVINVAGGSGLYVNQFGSSANAVLTKTGAGTFTVYGFQNHSAGSQIVVSQGEVDLYSDAGGGGANLSINASGGQTNLNTTQHLALLTVGIGANVAVTPQTVRSLLVTTLNMSGGTLDMANNDALLHNGNLTTVWQNLQTGYSNGAWTGVGIDSSSAAGDTTHLRALGVMLNKSAANQPIYTTFEGQPAAITDVLIKYTYYGDATLDGKVDGSDYSRIDFAVLANKTAGQNLYTGWANGDFNYDNIINGSDYTLIDNSFNTQGGDISAEIAATVAQISPAAAVPEPTGVAFICAGAFAALGRMRRRTSEPASSSEGIFPLIQGALSLIE